MRVETGGVDRGDGGKLGRGEASKPIQHAARVSGWFEIIIGVERAQATLPQKNHAKASERPGFMNRGHTRRGMEQM